jgi:hypothetical protein
MRPLRRVLVVPLIVMAVLGGLAGYFVARELAPPDDNGRLSVIALPATPTPTPSPTPKPTVTSRVTIRTQGGSTSDGCPAGCTCDRQPNGIVIRCTGR